MTLREDVLQKKPMEIERQFLIDTLPTLPAEYDTIRQGYVARQFHADGQARSGACS